MLSIFFHLQFEFQIIFLFYLYIIHSSDGDFICSSQVHWKKKTMQNVSENELKLFSIQTWIIIIKLLSECNTCPYKMHHKQVYK